jgi:hypothetical protein
MALSEDLSVFLNDFGVSVTAGAISGVGVLDMPGQVLAGGMVLSTDYTLTAKADDFGGLLYGDAITVDGLNYSVRETRRLDDGKLVEISLTKLAPDVPAPGSNPADYSLALGDLGDVQLTSPTAGEVLKYDGTQWVDGTDEGAGYVFTQSTAASTWTINHNLGHVPSVEVFDSGSQEIEADVSHPSVNQTVILFTVPTTGFARLI